jgi:uncharacterized protein (DUF427 family)
MKAIWNGTVIAESDQTIVVEGNHYFPPSSIKREYFSESSTHTTCPWKGLAHYRNIEVNGSRNPDAAWLYPEPKEAAEKLGITGYLAFWKGVEIKP